MSKTEADNCKKVEIWWLLRKMSGSNYKSGTIQWGPNGDAGSVGYNVMLSDGESYVRFHYTQTDRFSGEKKDFDYKVPLVRTPCRFGGYRYWYKCHLYKSGVYCGKRVGVLYKDGDWFGCRHCYELTYASRNQNRNYKHYPLFRTIELEMKIEKLMKKAKRLTWRGRLTKKQRKIQALNLEANRTFFLYEKSEKKP